MCVCTCVYIAQRLGIFLIWKLYFYWSANYNGLLRSHYLRHLFFCIGSCVFIEGNSPGSPRSVETLQAMHCLQQHYSIDTG